MSNLSNDLIEECEKAEVDNPDTTFSPELIMKLETLSLAEKREVVDVKSSSSLGAPLFIACTKGLLKMCEFLINICNADIEQRGLIKLKPCGNSSDQYNNVCPLWCAASNGHFLIVKLLVSKGANVNALTDYGSTPVWGACFESHIDIVKYLAENGADLSIRNYEGVTCLMSSYRSIELQKFLLEHGADINAIDNVNRTALYFAIIGDNIKAVEFLVENGANPHIHGKNVHDALQLACVRGKKEIFEYLVQNCKYTNDREADALELIGSTFSQTCELGKILAKMHWKFAARLRSKHNIFPKQYSARTNNTMLENSAKIVYENIREFSTEQEVTNMDLNNMLIQTLLIRDRILGPNHHDTLFSLVHLMEYYFENGKFQRSLEVRLYGLQVALRNGLFKHDIYFILGTIKLIRVIHRAETSGDSTDIWFVDLLAFAKIIVNELCNYRTLLSIKPVLESQMRNFDLILIFLVHLFHVLIAIAKTPDHIEYLKECVKKAVDCDPRSSKEDSLLHLAIYKSDMYDFNTEPDGNFPSLRVAKFLIECGANINSKNSSNSTPLHFVSNANFYFPEIAQYLLDCGAHDDLVNNKGNTALQLLSTNPANIILLNVPALKCLAIAAVGKNKIPYSGLIPEKLEEFVNFHNSNPDKNSPVEDLSTKTRFTLSFSSIDF